jgi:hypothetical protein
MTNPLAILTRATVWTAGEAFLAWSIKNSA